MKQHTMTILILAALLSTAGTLYLTWPPPPGSPNAILSMQKHGADEDRMLQSVQDSPRRFTLSVDQILELKNAGVSDRIVVALLTHEPRNPEAEKSKATPAPDEAKPVAQDKLSNP